MPHIKKNKLSSYKNSHGMKQQKPKKRSSGLEEAIQEGKNFNEQKKDSDKLTNTIKRDELGKVAEESERALQKKLRDLFEQLPAEDKLRKLLDEADKPFVVI